MYCSTEEWCLGHSKGNGRWKGWYIGFVLCFARIVFLRPVLWALGGLICVDNYVTRDPRVLQDDLSEDLLHLLPRPSQIPPCKNWKYCRRLGERKQHRPKVGFGTPLIFGLDVFVLFFPEVNRLRRGSGFVYDFVPQISIMFHRRDTYDTYNYTIYCI